MPLTPLQQRQRGAATLVVSLILLFMITFITFFSSRSLLFEAKASSNQYRSTQAIEAAEAGLGRATAWLAARTTASAATTCGTSGSPIPVGRMTWGACDASVPLSVYCPSSTACMCVNLSDTSCNTGGLALESAVTGSSQDGYTLDVTLRANASTPSDINRIEIVSVAETSSGTQRSRAVVSETIRVTPADGSSGPVNPNAPLLVKDGVEDVTGNPDICPRNPTSTNISGAGGRPDCDAGSGSVGTSIATMQNNTSGIGPGHFTQHGGSLSALGDPTGTVHSVLFPGVTEAQLLALSEYQRNNLSLAERNVFYYGTGSGYSVPNKFRNDDFGDSSASKPVIVYVSSTAYSGESCPGFFGDTFYGVFYMGRDCSGQGWGQADFYGTLAVEGTLTKFNANTILRYFDTSDLLGGGSDLAPGTASRVAGTWRDY